MSTKEDWYVRSINGICYVKFESQVSHGCSKFFCCWAKRRCKKLRALSISFWLFLWKRYCATPVMRWYACGLLRNLGRKQRIPDQKIILRPWLYSRKGLISLGAQNIWMSRVHETHVWDSSFLNRCLLDLTTKKLPRDILKVFERRRIFLTNFSTWQYF